jgi:hypothetical protein
VKPIGNICRPPPRQVPCPQRRHPAPHPKNAIYFKNLAHASRLARLSQESMREKTLHYLGNDFGKQTHEKVSNRFEKSI